MRCVMVCSGAATLDCGRPAPRLPEIEVGSPSIPMLVAPRRAQALVRGMVERGLLSGGRSPRSWACDRSGLLVPCFPRRFRLTYDGDHDGGCAVRSLLDPYRFLSRSAAPYGPEHRSGPLGLCFPCRFRLASDEGGVDEGRAGRSLLDPYRFLSRSAAKKHDGRTLQRAERTVASFGEAALCAEMYVRYHGLIVADVKNISRRSVLRPPTHDPVPMCVPSRGEATFTATEAGQERGREGGRGSSTRYDLSAHRPLGIRRHSLAWDSAPSCGLPNALLRSASFGGVDVTTDCEAVVLFRFDVFAHGGGPVAAGCGFHAHGGGDVATGYGGSSYGGGVGAAGCV